MVDLHAACEAQVVHGLYRFLNRPDTECTTTTAITLLNMKRLVYHGRDLFWHTHSRSEAWALFPSGWKQLAATMASHSMELLPHHKPTNWGHLPLSTLFTMADIPEKDAFPALSSMRT